MLAEELVADWPGVIPLRDRAGSVVAVTLVDAEEFAALAGSRWWLTGAGYAARSDSRSEGHRQVFMHRQLLGLVPYDGLQGDHRNGNGLDNQRANLRVATNALNAQNTSARSHSRSGIRGVWRRQDGAWEAQVRVGGVRHQARCATEAEAIERVTVLRREHMPFSMEAGR